MSSLSLYGVSFDLVEAPRLASRLASDGFPGRVGLGVLDARDLRPEDPASVRARVEPIAHRMGAERLLLHPNTSLEYLTSDGAVRKLHILSAVAQEFKEVSR